MGHQVGREGLTSSLRQARPLNVPTRGLLRLSSVLPIAAILVPLSILALVGWLNWRAVWQDAESEVRRAALSAAEYGQRTLESYSLVAGRVNDRLRGLSDTQIRDNEAILHEDLKRIGSELSQAELVYVIDHNGYPLLASTVNRVPSSASLADRDYFQALSGPRPPPVHVSRTFVGRFDGRLLFSVSRARRDTGNPPTADGFDGVVAVSVNPNVLAEGMRRLLPLPTDQMALVRTDGYAISTTSAVADSTPLPRVDLASPFHVLAGEGAKSAVYPSSTATSGNGGLAAMRSIEGFPVYAVITRAQAEIVSHWWQVMLPHMAFGLPATLGLFVLGLWVGRDQRRLSGMNRDLQRDNDLSTDRLDRVKRFGLIGTFEYDIVTGMNRRSAEYMSVQGLPAVPTGESHDDWARRLHPDDRQRAEGEVLRALSDESGDTDYAQTYRIVTPSGQVRWIAARGEITRDANGRAVRMRGAHVDVTPLRNTELALAESDARLRLAQESLGIGAWEWVPATRRLTCSRKFRELWNLEPGDETPTLVDVLSRIHPDDRRGLRSLLRDVRRTGGFRAEFRLLRTGAEGKSEPLWIAVRARQIKAPQMAEERLMGLAYDISDRKRAEELTSMMAHEVEHRAKNALAVVSSLLRMTKADTPGELVRILDGRVRALGQTMGLLGRGRWQGAELREIVESELEPFRRGGSGEDLGIKVEGPPVTVGVDAAQPISMALHELVTNAAKYGALSVGSGQLSVTWRIEGERIHLHWAERGGPRLDGTPPKKGFGSRLITMLFEGQIGGTVDKRWEPEGLVCEMSFPARAATAGRRAG
ncbi:hypothetical protein STHU_11040 [Allostella humosa]|nr:PAS domain-containing protein [Stella humosa]BBK30470.1 hypothetical protein STHU_11040 [Stella humosa]